MNYNYPMNNKIVISKNNLELILNTHKKEIGKNKEEIGEKIFAIIGFWVGTISYDGTGKILSLDVKTIFILASILYTVWALSLIARSFYNPFDSERLLMEIEDNSEISKKYKHSIVLIKDTFRKYPNKYLVYYDTRWNCWLFPNWYTMNTTEENENNIISHISQDLKIDKNKISISFLLDKIHSKFSQSAKKDKIYHHNFYKAMIENSGLNNWMHKNEFISDGKNYRWMSIAEMESDKNIMDKNSDIVEIVKKSGY